MFSDAIKSVLEREIVGQPRAVNSVVRGVTRAVSGLVPREGPLCAYLLMGPSGTGKTHLVQTLARLLHGHEKYLVVAECTYSGGGDPWISFVSQLAPHLRRVEAASARTATAGAARTRRIRAGRYGAAPG